MATSTKYINTSETGVKWYICSGKDYGTAYDFKDGETVGVTEDGRILDEDGQPVTPSDRFEIAVRNALDL